MNQNEITIIKGCKLGNRNAQRSLYELYYGYGMSLALRYTASKEEVEEILNDSFIKVFKKIAQYDAKKAFKNWFRQIVVNTAIDYYRKKKKHTVELNETYITGHNYNVALDKFGFEDILKLIQKLAPSYRMVFNLAVIEGYKHHEIAEQLNISVGTSKSNLSRARKLLQEMINDLNTENRI